MLSNTQNVLLICTIYFIFAVEWLTEDLLSNIQKNETLANRLSDPSFTRAISEFQTNPQAAMLKYQNNPEMQQFLKDFCGILGKISYT